MFTRTRHGWVSCTLPPFTIYSLTLFLYAPCPLPQRFLTPSAACMFIVRTAVPTPGLVPTARQGVRAGVRGGRAPETCLCPELVARPLHSTRPQAPCLLPHAPLFLLPFPSHTPQPSPSAHCLSRSLGFPQSWRQWCCSKLCGPSNIRIRQAYASASASAPPHYTLCMLTRSAGLRGLLDCCMLQPSPPWQLSTQVRTTCHGGR